MPEPWAKEEQRVLPAVPTSNTPRRGAGAAFRDSESTLQLNWPKPACHPGQASLAFSSLLIPELNQQELTLLTIKMGVIFAWLDSLHQLATGAGVHQGRTLRGWEQERGKGTNRTQQQSATNMKAQLETVNVKLKSPLLVWKQILLCFEEPR